MEARRERHADQLGALGHPIRLAILRYVVQGHADGSFVSAIQCELEIPSSTLSHHIERLASAGLLKARREGTYIYYRADYEQLKSLTDYLWEDCCQRGNGCC